MEEQDKEEDIKVVAKSFHSNEVTAEEPKDNRLRDLRQILRSIESRKAIETKDITTIEIPREVKDDKIYREDTPSAGPLYSVEGLDNTLREIRTNNSAYFKSLNRASIKSISSKTMDRYIENLAKYNTDVVRLGRADRIPNYLKLANKINISTLKEINKINKFNTFFSKNYIIEQSEAIRKQDVYSKTLMGSINNLSKIMDKKLESIKINTSVTDLYKAHWKDIHKYNVQSFIAKKYGQVLVWGIEKVIDGIVGAFKSGKNRRKDGEGGEDLKEKALNTFSDTIDTVKTQAKEAMNDLKTNLQPEKLKAHLKGGDGSGDTATDMHTETIKDDIRAIRAMFEDKFYKQNEKPPTIPRSLVPGGGRSGSTSTEGSVVENAIRASEDFFNKMSGKTKDAFSDENIEKFKKTVNDASTNLFDKTKNINKNEILEKLSSNLDKAKDKLGNKEDFLNFAKEKLKNIKNIDKDTITNIVEEYSENLTLEKAKKTLQDTIDNLLYEPLTMDEKFRSNLLDRRSKEERNRIKNTINKGLSKAKDLTPESVNKIFESIDASELSVETKEKLNQIKEQTNEQLRNKFELIKDHLKDVNLNDVQEKVIDILVEQREMLKNLSKEDLEAYLKTSLENIKELDKDQVKELIKKLPEDIYGAITSENIKKSLENGFSKLKTSKHTTDAIESFKNWRNKKQEDLEMRAMSDDSRVASYAKFQLKVQEGSKGLLDVGKSGISEGFSSSMDALKNWTKDKSDLVLDDIKKVFDENKIPFEKVLESFTEDEVADLFGQLGYDGVTGSDVYKYRRKHDIRLKEIKKDKKELLAKQVLSLKDGGIGKKLVKGRDTIINSGMNLLGGARTLAQYGTSTLPWAEDFNDEDKVRDRERRFEDREDMKKNIKEGFDNIGGWFKKKGNKLYTTAKQTVGIWEDKEEQKPVDKKENLDELSIRLIGDVQKRIDVEDDVIIKYLDKKKIKYVGENPDVYDAYLTELTQKVYNKKVSIFGTGKIGEFARKGLDFTIGNTWRGGRAVNRGRKSSINKWERNRAEKLRQEIIDEVKSGTHFKDITDEEINSHIVDKELMSVVSVGPGGWAFNKIRRRRTRYKNKIIKKIVETRVSDDGDATELNKQFKGLLGIRRKSLGIEVRATEQDKANKEKLRKEIIDHIQSVDNTIEKDDITKFIDEEELLKVVLNTKYNKITRRKWRYINKIFDKVAKHNKNKKDDIFDTTELGKLRKRSRKLFGDKARKWKLGRNIRKQYKLNTEDSNKEVQEIMDDERNKTLDKINKGIAKLGTFFKPKKSLTDKDGDGDDDESYFDKDKEEVEVDEDGKPIEKKEDESKSLLSKIGEFIGPIANIFGGVASALGGTISMLGGIASGALSLVGGITGTLGTLAAYLGLRKLGLKSIGAKLTGLISKLKGVKVPGTSGWLGKAGTWLGSGAKSAWSGTKFFGKNLGKFRNPIALGAGAYGALMARNALASEEPQDENFDFSNMGNEFSQQPNMSDEWNIPLGDQRNNNTPSGGYDLFPKEEVQTEDQERSNVEHVVSGLKCRCSSTRCYKTTRYNSCSRYYYTNCKKSIY